VVAQVTLGALAAVTVGWAGSLAHQAFLSLDLMPLQALPLLIAAPVLWPLAQPADGAPPGRWLGAALVLAGLALTAWVRFSDPYDARHPHADTLVYRIDADTGRAWRVSLAPELDAWSRRTLLAEGGALTRLAGGVWPGARYAAAARPVAIPPTEVELQPLGGDRYRLRVIPPAAVRDLSLQLTADRPAQVESLGGAPLRLALRAGRPTRILWSGGGAAELVLEAPKPNGLTVAYRALLPGWPAEAPPPPPRPPEVMAFGVSGATYVTGARRLAW